METINEPYFKVERNGKVLNPITKANPFLHDGPNRKQRREALQKHRHRGNNKGNAITVVGKWKYKKTLQEIKQVMCKDREGNWNRMQDLRDTNTGKINWDLLTEAKTITKTIAHSVPA